MLARKLLCALLLLVPSAARAQDDLILAQPMSRAHRAASSVFGTANTNCAGAACDTVWLGHSASGPGGSFLGVGVGGVWDFDADIAGTDSSQGWKHFAQPYTFGPTRPANQRLEWAYDYGNQINQGNTALWAARDLAGRKYVKTGVAGAWHADDLAGVKLNVLNNAEPSAIPIAGTRSAWCGLRTTGDTHAIDALTGNALNSDLFVGAGLSASLGEWPGFCNLWDQMLYKDFPSTGTGTVQFRVRTDMSNFIDTSTNGSGWFNPDPTSPLNFVNNTADSFMVYVGSPNESAYDTNRRWFSEVLDLSKPWKELFAVSGKTPVAGTDTTVNKAYAGVVPTGGVVRVVFRVKTNRVRADATTGTATGFNSKDGAAVLDQVAVDGGAAAGFDLPGDITARALIPDLALAGGPWATTGKPPASYFHVRNLSSLPYNDLCGAVGSPNRFCNLVGNVLLGGDFDQGEKHVIEHNDIAESPTISLAIRTAPPGTKDAQGLEAQTAARTSAVIQFDFAGGFSLVETGVIYNFGARSYSPTTWKQPVSGLPTWSTYYGYPFILGSIVPKCEITTYDLTSLGFPAGAADSVKLVFQSDTQAYRFGGGTGDPQGYYFDNVRFGLVRAPAPPIDITFLDRLQDQFPANAVVTPGDNSAFDTTTALMRTGRNISTNSSFHGLLIAGDSLVARAAFAGGNGTTTGTRCDLVFRILPGPGSYSVPGDRTSPLVNRDPAHPFYATYLAANGPFGTPGGHGGAWNPDVWNSARMDTAEYNLHPVGSVPETGPQTDLWMGTLHEGDPNFAALAVDHARCFLVTPSSGFFGSAVQCGAAPPLYGAVPVTTREGTKILPDGWFTPGTHIEYFVRRSSLEAPAVASLLPDTSKVTPQGTGDNAFYDQERWWSADVLPDFWKSVRFGGGGLACMLLVDQADRRGADPAYLGALDTLGYGKNNGASTGWRGLAPNADPNDPAGFIAANRGQAGYAFDHYDVIGGEADRGAGAIGARLSALFNPVSDRSGPTAAMLATFYSTVVHSSGDISWHTLSDGDDTYEPGNDVALYRSFLAAGTPANPKNLWLTGNNFAEDAYDVSISPAYIALLADSMGVSLVDDSYKEHAFDPASPIAFQPTASWAHPGRVYGLANSCEEFMDVLAPSGAAGAVVAAQYGTSGLAASIARPSQPGVRNYRTLVDGFELGNLRSIETGIGSVGTHPETDHARFAWLKDVLAGHFQACGPPGPVIAVGDLPGVDAARFVTAVTGAQPNPARAGAHVALRFLLARPQAVRLRIFDVAGREVARLAQVGTAGENVAHWDGRRADGGRAAAGVYFYALDGAPRAASKLVLLGN
jgi:hypothetical protein